MSLYLLTTALLATTLFATAASAQRAGTHYDETRVPDYTLPDPLVHADGTPVKDAADWHTHRRPEILALFETHVYGRAPAHPDPADLVYEILETDESALNNTAIRRQVRIYLTGDRDGPAMDLLVYVPSDADGPVPVFLGLNFRGNHTIHPDPAIGISDSWMPVDDKSGVVDHKATAAGRGTRASRWPVEAILARGYGLATIYCGDIDPDFHDGFNNGLHPSFYKDNQPPTTRPAPDEWGTLAAWAWGLSRALDYLAADPLVDGDRVAVVGHSRLGKAALWAGATDQRFALVVSNNSGCGGAALSRRRYGETVAVITTAFPHWFCGNFKEYADNEAALPVDQHQLLALIAPRPLYIASAEKDHWADPRGEFLAAYHATPVYQFLGLDGLPADDLPPVDTPVHGTIAYHLRSGGHDITAWDWSQFMTFADEAMGE